MIDIAFLLLILHGPDGRDINVNIEQITSIRCRVPGAKNELFADSVNAIVWLTDGRHISVIETCGQIRDKMKLKKNEPD